MNALRGRRMASACAAAASGVAVSSRLVLCRPSLSRTQYVRDAARPAPWGPPAGRGGRWAWAGCPGCPACPAWACGAWTRARPTAHGRSSQGAQIQRPRPPAPLPPAPPRPSAHTHTAAPPPVASGLASLHTSARARTRTRTRTAHAPHTPHRPDDRSTNTASSSVWPRLPASLLHIRPCPPVQKKPPPLPPPPPRPAARVPRALGLAKPAPALRAPRRLPCSPGFLAIGSHWSSPPRRAVGVRVCTDTSTYRGHRSRGRHRKRSDSSPPSTQLPLRAACSACAEIVPPRRPPSASATATVWSCNPVPIQQFDLAQICTAPARAATSFGQPTAAAVCVRADGDRRQAASNSPYSARVMHWLGNGRRETTT